jgi:hypothetical protein
MQCLVSCDYFQTSLINTKSDMCMVVGGIGENRLHGRFRYLPAGMVTSGNPSTAGFG